MRKIKRGLTVTWILILGLALSGCQLAKVEAGSLEEDALVGVFITREHLDLLDLESYFKDHPGQLNGGQITLDPTEGYQKKIYAVLKESMKAGLPVREPRDPDVQIPSVKSKEFVFEGIDGIPLFAALIPGETKEESYYSTMVSDEVQDVQMNLNKGDKEDAMSLKGTIFFEPNREDVFFQINPVYQSSDGRVYLTSGTGMGYSGHSGGEGQILTKRLESMVDVVRDGVSKKKSHSIEVSFEAVFATKSVIVIEMDKHHTILREYGLDLLDLPRELDLGTNTEYVIFEDHRLNEAGQWNVKRRILDPKEGSFSLYQPNEQGIMVRKSTILNWPAQTP